MKQETKDNILMVILGITFFLNIIIMNLFPPSIKKLVVVGYIILGIGALFFILSVVSLRKKGINHVVDSGIYAIIRHPMYLGAIVMYFSHIFFGQNWIVIISTIIAIMCCYLIIKLGDQRNIEKFGEDYKLYMQRVPRMNFFAGIIRLIIDRKREEKQQVIKLKTRKFGRLE